MQTASFRFSTYYDDNRYTTSAYKEIYPNNKKAKKKFKIFKFFASHTRQNIYKNFYQDWNLDIYFGLWKNKKDW